MMTKIGRILLGITVYPLILKVFGQVPAVWPPGIVKLYHWAGPQQREENAPQT
ncbi:hypothetical protein D082_14550 [Synechocystis sp. PCC 6714]|nr:hypothetical protein D082_14550 [Synechocystis sp. PCC 6714]